jgi:collagenase-like PrtC family protease
VYFESRSTRTELIAAQEKARTEAVAATAKVYRKAISDANDKVKVAERQRDLARKEARVHEIRAKLKSRPRTQCLFSDEDMKDINEAGKN